MVLHEFKTKSLLNFHSKYSILGLLKYHYIHIHTHTNTHTYIQTHTHTHTYTHTCIHTCMHTYVRTYVHTYLSYIYIYIYIYTHTYIHTYTHIHTYIYTHTYIHIHTYIHTYIHTGITIVAYSHKSISLLKFPFLWEKLNGKWHPHYTNVWPRAHIKLRCDLDKAVMAVFRCILRQNYCPRPTTKIYPVTHHLYRRPFRI